MPDYDYAPHLARWGLVPDGVPIVTHSSHLLPVRHHGAPAMLKLPEAPDEFKGLAARLRGDRLAAERCRVVNVHTSVFSGHQDDLRDERGRGEGDEFMAVDLVGGIAAFKINRAIG